MWAQTGKIIGLTLLSGLAIFLVYSQLDKHSRKDPSSFEEDLECQTCPMDMYFDRSACQCLKIETCEPLIECVDQTVPDPRYDCQCSPVGEVEALFDIDECLIDECPKQKDEEEVGGPTEDYDCDSEGNKVCKGQGDCGETFNYFWNDKACMCFSLIYCTMMCPEGL